MSGTWKTVDSIILLLVGIDDFVSVELGLMLRFIEVYSTWL